MRKKISFVVNTFDKRDRGGVLRIVSELSNKLINYYDVNIISFGIVYERAYDLNSKVNLISLSMGNYNTSFYKGLSKIIWFKEAREKIKPYIVNDEVWLTTSPPISLLFSCLKFEYKKIKVIGCDHTSTIYKKNFFIQKIRNILLSKLDIMVGLTPQDAQYYLDHGINSVCIPNGIDFSKVNEFNSAKKHLIYVGRFNEEKQPFKAVDLFTGSSLYGTDITLKMYGHGDYENELEQYVLDKGYDKYVKIIKGETDPDVIYKDAFALILTSKIEGFGLVLLEAMARNIPCLSFKIPYGPLNIINNGINGFFINDSVLDFDEKSKLILELDENLIEKSISMFDINEIVILWEKLILDIYERY